MIAAKWFDVILAILACLVVMFLTLRGIRR
jgi:hypothetical protein